MSGLTENLTLYFPRKRIAQRDEDGKPNPDPSCHQWKNSCWYHRFLDGRRKCKNWESGAGETAPIGLNVFPMKSVIKCKHSIKYAFFFILLCL